MIRYNVKKAKVNSDEVYQYQYEMAIPFMMRYLLFDICKIVLMEQASLSDPMKILTMDENIDIIKDIIKTLAQQKHHYTGNVVSTYKYNY